MKRRKEFAKRMMASVIAAAMLMTSVPMTAFAEEPIVEMEIAEGTEVIEEGNSLYNQGHIEEYSWTRDYPGGNELGLNNSLNIYTTDVHLITKDAEQLIVSDIVLEVKKVSVDDAKNVNSNGEKIISVTQSEDIEGRWQINGLHYGCTTISIVVKDKSGTETTIERDIYVTGCVMRPTFTPSEDGDYELSLVNPNGKDLVYYVTRYTTDENGEIEYDCELFRGSTINSISTTISGQNPMQITTDWYYEVAILVNDIDFSDIEFQFGKPTPKEAVAATCTESGNIAYEYVENTGNIYVTDQDGNYVQKTLQEVTIPALGHKVVKDAAVAATFTSTGKTEGSHCSRCDEVLKAQQTVAMKTLAKPVIASLENVSTGVKVTWKKVNEATGYYVYRGNTKVATISSGATLTYIDKGAKTNGTKYSYKVYAFCKPTKDTIVKSGASATKNCYFLTCPTISTAANNAAKKMEVTWKKNSKATGYQIKYVTGKKTTTVNVSGASTVAKKIGGLTKGKTYKVYLRSCKKVSGVSYYSEWSAAKTVKIKK